MGEINRGSKGAAHLFPAKRENNPNREHIIVNIHQAKHYPSNPLKSLELFESLAQTAAQDGRADKPSVVVAFSETATAIGAVTAGAFRDCFFVTTTRERLPDWTPKITFEESHSHAKQHYLCVRDENLFRRAAQLFIVDDEFTTGNTAVNLIKALDGCLAPECKIYAVSLAASEESRERFEDAGVTLLTLASIEDIANKSEPPYVSPDVAAVPRKPDVELCRNAVLDPRLGVNAESYLKECRELCAEIARDIDAEGLDCVEIVGTEEFCYPPLLLGSMLAAKAKTAVVHCTTRSPMLPCTPEDNCAGIGFAPPECGAYPMVRRTPLESVYDDSRKVFLYNAEKCALSVIMTDAENPARSAAEQLCGAVLGEKCAFVQWRTRTVQTSYSPDDVKLLLTDVTGKLSPLPPEERERLIQSGRHYSELLPQEYRPSERYIAEYENGLKLWAKANADAVATVAEAIWAENGRSAVLVSLARAGTPAGVLIKRYIRRKYGVSPPHYSISIVIGKGIDRRALEYIFARHSLSDVRFIDGWTGKGTILRTLRRALEEFPLYEYGAGRDSLERLSELAVLADPAGLCRICGTHEDMFIPCACLNSVVSGLFSRTVLDGGDHSLLSSGDFHGAVYFGEFRDIDRTNEYIAAVEREMTYGRHELPSEKSGGCSEAYEIAERFGVADIGLVKPGIGETTRVLLRRVPRLILLRDINSPLTRHLVELAAEKGVEVREYPLRNYYACGIVKVMNDV